MKKSWPGHTGACNYSASEERHMIGALPGHPIPCTCGKGTPKDAPIPQPLPHQEEKK